jgi:hypothetical protein
MANTNEHAISLHPDHLNDLKKSDLSDETIREAGIYSVPPRDISKKLEGHFPKVESLLAFPYPETNGFERYKLFPSQGNVKYYQRAGTPARLYIPPRARAALPNTLTPVYLTEGEKKALKAVQEGLFCVALGGLWCWSDGGEGKKLIPDFDLFKWDGRTIYIVPDNDWLLPDHHGERKNLREAVYQLAYRLIDRGAKAYVIELPQGPEKVGLDDYLCQHSIDEFKALLKKEIRKKTVKEMIEEANLDNLPEILKRLASLKETERAVFINALSKKLDVPKRVIQKDLKRCEPQKADDTEILTTAYFPELVDLCIDEGGKVVFLINRNGIPETSTMVDINGTLYKPPDKEKIPFLLPRAEIVASWINQDTGKNLFNDLLNRLKCFSFIPDHQFIITTCFIFLTYVQDHSEIQYFPMLLFWSSPERGKSRTGKAVANCSFRGLHIVDMREANLFRYSQDFHSTLFIDLMDLWKKAERNQSEDILLLRYEKGARVARVLYPEKGAFKDMVYFGVYGPTVMATNEPVHHILDTRCLPILMPNKPENYENPTAEKLLEIKERLTAWRFKTMGKPLPVIEPIPGINGRLWDISKPLFQVCQMVWPSYWETLKMAILEISGQRIEEKQDSLEGQIVGILNNLSPDGSLSEWNIPLDDVMSKINENRPEGHKLTSRYIGQRVKSIGLKKRRIATGYQIEVTRFAFNILLSQFGFKNIPIPTPTETFTTFTDTHRSTDSEVYGMNVGVNVDEYSPNVHSTFIKENPNISKGCEHSVCHERSARGKENKTENLFEVMDDGQRTY